MGGGGQRERARARERRREVLRGSVLANHSPFHGASLSLALAYLGLYIDVLKENYFSKYAPTSIQQNPLSNTFIETGL